jgi:hypothetical protein
MASCGFPIDGLTGVTPELAHTAPDSPLFVNQHCGPLPALVEQKVLPKANAVVGGKNLEDGGAVQNGT